MDLGSLSLTVVVDANLIQKNKQLKKEINEEVFNFITLVGNNEELLNQYPDVKEQLEKIINKWNKKK
jgi:ribose 5-phosphate isomerase RpiB